MRIRMILTVVGAAAVLGGLCMGAAGGAGPTSPGPPQFPGPFARYAHVLQENRGGAVPTEVTDQTGTSNKPIIEVTDSAGQYRAAFTQNTFPKPSVLSQIDLGSDKATRWMIDPRDGSIAGPPIQSTYSTQTITMAPGAPGVSTTPPPGVTPPNPNVPPGANGSAAPTASNSSLASYDTSISGGGQVNICNFTFFPPGIGAFYYQWWILGETWDTCTYSTNMILGSSIDQLGWDYQWHPVSSPDSGGGTSTQEYVEDVRYCLNYQQYGGFGFRVRGWSLLEWEGLYAGGTGYSQLVLLQCQDSTLWTGTVSP